MFVHLDWQCLGWRQVFCMAVVLLRDVPKVVCLRCPSEIHCLLVHPCVAQEIQKKKVHSQNGTGQRSWFPDKFFGQQIGVALILQRLHPLATLRNKCNICEEHVTTCSPKPCICGVTPPPCGKPLIFWLV